MVELIQVQKQVQRTIYEALRLNLVDQGFLPDISLFPNTLQGKNTFEAAKNAITTDKGFCIDLLSFGSYQAKGLKKVPRIVLNKGRFLPGEVGSPPGVIYIKQEDNSYKSFTLPPNTSNLSFEAMLVSSEDDQDIAMTSILGDSLSTRKYLQIWDSEIDTDRFLVIQTGFYDLQDNDEGITTRVFEYTVPDLYISRTIEMGDVASINEIVIENEDLPDSIITENTTPNP